MKECLTTIGVILLAIAILVAGYYLGIVVAVLSVIIGTIFLVVVILTFISYSIWETWHDRRRRNRDS